MRYVRPFARFWYDFIVGDEWRIAAVVVVAVAATAAFTHAGWNAWPVLPLAVCAVLGVAVRRHRPRRASEATTDV